MSPFLHTQSQEVIVNALHLERVRTLAHEARKKLPSFNDDVFRKLLIKMDRKYNVDRLAFWETMRYSANELELKGFERKVYLSAAAKYFSQNKRLRAARYTPEHPPKPPPRMPGTGTIVLHGRQLAWNL